MPTSVSVDRRTKYRLTSPATWLLLAGAMLLAPAETRVTRDAPIIDRCDVFAPGYDELRKANRTRAGSEPVPPDRESQCRPA